jgi:hypothetical protein
MFGDDKETVRLGAREEGERSNLSDSVPSSRKHFTLQRSLVRVERINGKTRSATVSKRSGNKDVVDFEASISEGQPNVPW